MGYIRTGICNHCGKCCKPPVVTENPMIELGQDKCKFYVETDNGELYGHCLVKGSWAPIEFTRDRFGTLITQAQIDWYNENCVRYPTVEDFLEGSTIPSECSFGVVEVT